MALGRSESEETEIEALRRHGWEDDEIDAMSPSTRRQFFQEAMATGQSERPNAAPEPSTELRRYTCEALTKPQTGRADGLGAKAAEPRSAQAKTIRRLRWFSPKLIYGAVGAIALYAIFEAMSKDEPPVPTGWETLSRCSFAASFDGKRHLTLSEITSPT
jgi:hypothetical protein